MRGKNPEPETETEVMRKVLRQVERTGAVCSWALAGLGLRSKSWPRLSGDALTLRFIAWYCWQQRLNGVRDHGCVSS
jgi:hypothetical protein